MGQHGRRCGAWLFTAQMDRDRVQSPEPTMRPASKTEVPVGSCQGGRARLDEREREGAGGRTGGRGERGTYDVNARFVMSWYATEPMLWDSAAIGSAFQLHPM